MGGLIFLFIVIFLLITFLPTIILWYKRNKCPKCGAWGTLSFVKEVVKDIQRALIQSDVNIKLVLDLSKKIESRALEEEPPKGITPREHVITIIYEEMVNLLGSEAAGLDINDRPYKILFLGLQGSGKTTTIGKLCRYLQKKGFNPAVVCTDTWRPAAYEQLRQLTEEMDIPLYGDPENKDALDLAQKGLKEFTNNRV